MTHESLRSLLVAGSLRTAALHVTARGLGFLTMLLLAAVLESRGYGVYAWAVACVTVLRIPAAAGRDRLLVRELARGRARGLLRDAALAVAIASLVVGGAALAVALTIDSRLTAALAVGVVLLPLVAALSVAQGALQGLGRIGAALAPDALLRPLLFGGLVLVAADLSPEGALLLQALATGAALAATLWLLRRHLPSAAPAVEGRPWSRSGMTITLNNGLFAFGQRIDLILVGVLLGASEAGVYAVAVAAASLAAMPVAIVAVPLSPAVSRLHADGERERLARVLAAATRATFAATLVGAAVVAAAGPLGLGLLGEDFARGAVPLAVLCLAALVNSAFAANNLTLLMAGEERAAAVAMAVGAAAAAALSAAMIPLWGLNGAAAAVVLSTLVRNLVASRFTRTRLTLDTTVLARPHAPLTG